VSRMLWPRILYWGSFTLMLVGLFYALTGTNTDDDFVSRSYTQTGGAGVAFIALVGMMCAKAWMDYVVRSRTRLPCPRCATKNPFSAMHCSSCGIALRVVVPAGQAASETREDLSTGLGVVCQRCATRNIPSARFCSSCAAPLTAPRAV
jgi:ribosomal protein L40E